MPASSSPPPAAQGRFEPHFALAVNFLETEFQVRARYLTIIDRTLQRADDTTISATAGLSYKAADRWRLVGELFYSPLGDLRRRTTATSNEFRTESQDLFNVRAMITYSVR